MQYREQYAGRCQQTKGKKKQKNKWLGSILVRASLFLTNLRFKKLQRCNIDMLFGAQFSLFNTRHRLGKGTGL